MSRKQNGPAVRLLGPQLSLGEQQAAIASLTPSELMTMTLIFEGQSNRQIGKSLGMAENSVKYLVRMVFAKLRVKSRIELVTRYWEARPKEAGEK